VELSSFQCHYLEASPAVVGLTALFPEHLDWHGDLDTYYGDKLGIVADQPPSRGRQRRRCHSGPRTDTRHPRPPVTWVGQGHEWHLEADGDESWLCRGEEKLFHTGSSRMLGRHNHQNMLMALALATPPAASR
jgi:UDP-N-acetylmuramoylalanine-D-glutamate ligase